MAPDPQTPVDPSVDTSVDIAWFEGLLADTSDPLSHAAQARSEHADLLGPLVLRASGLEPFRELLPAGAHGVRVHLVADAGDDRDGLTSLREARNGLFDDDRVEVVGVQLGLPPDADPGTAAAVLLAVLDFTAPAWLQVPLVDGWQRALEVVADDGTEHVAVDVSTDPAGLAAFVRRSVDLGLSFRVTGAPDRPIGAVRDPAGAAPVPGVLDLLAAVRGTLDGDPVDRVEAMLRSTDPAPAAAVLRRAGAAEAAATRAALRTVDTVDVAAVVGGLADLGLLGD